MFRCLAQGVHGLFDLISFLPGSCCDLGLRIILPGTAFTSGDGNGFCSFLCSSPGGDAYLVKRFGCPLNDVERINASFTVRSELVDALGDPLGAIAATLGADQNMLFQLSGQGIVTH